MVSAFNTNEEILASDYSNTTYFEITGENKDYYLSKLTHFDLRPKKFPVSTMAQTLIAKIDCSIYHLKDKYIVTCNRSFEDYFKNLTKSHTNLTFNTILSEPSAKTDRRTGFLADIILQDFSDLDGFKAYLAGPPIMVETSV